LITTGPSVQAIIRNSPPQVRQISMAIPNTPFTRCAQLIAAQRLALNH
jgi:hypothetical protein